jgi:hypothetical protein
LPDYSDRTGGRARLTTAASGVPRLATNAAFVRLMSRILFELDYFEF